MTMRRAAARSGEWAQHFSNASCCICICICTSCDGSLDVAESADLEVGDGVCQVVGGEREERQQRRTHDLRTALHDRPSTHTQSRTDLDPTRPDAGRGKPTRVGSGPVDNNRRSQMLLLL